MTLPYSGSASSTSTLFSISNTLSGAAANFQSNGGVGIQVGSSSSPAIFAYSNSSSGLNAQSGSSSVPAVAATAAGSSGGIGVSGTANTGNGSGVYGLSYGPTGYGVHGRADSSGAVAVYGRSTSGKSARFEGGSGGTGFCEFNGGTGWNCTSDRNLKKDFRKVDAGDLLDKLEKMPVYTYRMKADEAPVRYLGPTAQDFRAAFGLGDTDKLINTGNAQGVALAAAKALIERAKADEAKIAALEAEVASLRKDRDRVAGLESLVVRQTALIQQFGAQLEVMAKAQPLVRASAVR